MYAFYLFTFSENTPSLPSQACITTLFGLAVLLSASSFPVAYISSIGMKEEDHEKPFSKQNSVLNSVTWALRFVFLRNPKQKNMSTASMPMLSVWKPWFICNGPICLLLSWSWSSAFTYLSHQGLCWTSYRDPCFREGGKGSVLYLECIQLTETERLTAFGMYVILCMCRSLCDLLSLCSISGSDSGNGSQDLPLVWR